MLQQSLLTTNLQWMHPQSSSVLRNELSKNDFSQANARAHQVKMHMTEIIR